MPASTIESITTTPKKQKIRGVVRNATEQDWLKVNPIPDKGEIVYTSDLNNLKVGDGVTHYNALSPIAGGGGTSDYEELSNKPAINNVTLSGDKSSSDLGLQDTLVSGTNIKTINGNSLVGSGNVELSTYLPFPIAWDTGHTTKDFCDDINADVTAVEGMAYLGEVTFTDMPNSIGNAEVVVEIMMQNPSNKIIKLTLSSGNVSPYMWVYTYWNNGANVSGWQTWQEPLVSGTNIKTVNNNSLLGSGNITIDSLPSQSGQSGKYLTTDGSTASWASVPAAPIVNYSIDGGNYTAGSGSYAITRFSLILQKQDFTWEKPTDTSVTYTDATNKTANTSGFLLNQIRYYGHTSTLSTGQITAENKVYSKFDGVPMSWSTNCGTTPAWSLGTWVYLVGSIGNDGLFYLDTTQWWSTSLPNANDGKLYIRLGTVTTSNTSQIAFLEDRPIFYHDGVGIKEYVQADNKQDLISDLSTIRSGAAAGATAVQPGDLSSYVTLGTGQTITANKTFTGHIKLQGANAAISAGDSILQEKALLQRSGGVIVIGNTSDPVKVQGSGRRPAYGDNDSFALLSDVPAAQVQSDWNQSDNTKVDYIKNKPNLSVYALDSDVNAIEDLIPSAATTSNQLADKDFVNSSIANMAANYVTSNAQGDNFASHAALINGPYYHKGTSYTPTNNDYALVETDEDHSNATTRYIYDGAQWAFQYIVNNSPFSQAQLDAINSGITAGKVTTYDSLVSNVQADWNAVSGLAQILNKPTLAAVATSGSYSDLSNTPTLGTAAAANASDFATAAQGSKADTAIQSISTGSTNGTIDVDGVDVAVYGLGSAAYTASSAYATSTQGGKADTAVQPGDLAAVATSGNYSDLSGTPTIPTVNNPTITITQGGVTKGSFTLNQSSGDTIALDAGGGGGSLPSQTGHAGEFLKTDGTDASWDIATAVTFRIW